MSDISYFRERAEQALRLAHQMTDPILINKFTELAHEYLARADVIDSPALGKDPEDE
jgi:hypothetical protein